MEDHQALPDDRPVTLATAYLRDAGHGNDVPLRHWRDTFFRWNGCVYDIVKEDELRAEIRRWLNSQMLSVTNSKGRQYSVPMGATIHHVNEVVAEIEGQTKVFDVEQMPCWLDDNPRRPRPSNIVAFENGLLNVVDFVTEGRMVTDPPTPNWFSVNALPCRFDPSAKCPQWLKFLRSTLEDDEQIQLLQEWFGYILTPDTSMQKMLWMHGRPGAGKGVIQRMMKRVVGERNCASFTLWGLTQRFALSSMLDKTLAISADAHLSKETDSLRAIEILKAVSGEDTQLVDRKNREMIADVLLMVRFVLSINEFPTLPDASAAIRRRALLLSFTKSFEGCEDIHLFRRLEPELPGIVAWSLVGLKSLRQRGRFCVTEKGRELSRRFTRLNSSIHSFLEDACYVAPEELDGGHYGYWVSKDDLYAGYQTWCKKNGHHAMSKERLGEAVQAAAPTIRSARPRQDGSRTHIYEGMQLLPEYIPSYEDVSS